MLRCGETWFGNGNGTLERALASADPTRSKSMPPRPVYTITEDKRACEPALPTAESCFHSWTHLQIARAEPESPLKDYPLKHPFRLVK